MIWLIFKYLCCLPTRSLLVVVVLSLLASHHLLSLSLIHCYHCATITAHCLLLLPAIPPILYIELILFQIKQNSKFTCNPVINWNRCHGVYCLNFFLSEILLYLWWFLERYMNTRWSFHCFYTDKSLKFLQKKKLFMKINHIKPINWVSSFMIFFLCSFQAIASPREFLLNKLPFPLPTPAIFNLDHINALTLDTVVSKNGLYHWKEKSMIIFYCKFIFSIFLNYPQAYNGLLAALTFNDLGIVPHKLKGYPVEFLSCYRKGGPSFGSTVSEKISSSDI